MKFTQGQVMLAAQVWQPLQIISPEVSHGGLAKSQSTLAAGKWQPLETFQLKVRLLCWGWRCAVRFQQRPSACSAMSPIGSGLATPPGSVASSTPRSGQTTDRSGHSTRTFAPSLQAQMSRRARRSTSVGRTGEERPSTGGPRLAGHVVRVCKG